MATNSYQTLMTYNQDALYAMKSPLSGFTKVVDRFGEIYHLKSSQMNQHHRTPQVCLVNPSTALSGAWSAGSIDFQVPKDMIHLWTSFNLELTVTNSTGAAIKLLPTFLLFDFIDILIDGKTLMHITSEALYASLALYTEEQINAIAPYANMSTSFGAASGTLADGATATYYLPTDALCPFKTFGGLFTPGLKGDVRIRAQLKPAANVFVTGSTCTINSLNLRVFGYELPVDEYNSLQDVYMNDFVDYKFLDVQLFTSVVGSETSGTNYTRQLSAINGVCPFMFAFERPANPTGASTYNLLALDDVQVLDAGGRPVLGNNPLDSNYLLSMYYAENLPDTSMMNSVNNYVISFCQSIPLTMKSGAVLGCRRFNGQWSLQYTSQTTASNELDVIAFVFSRLRINKGNAYIIPS